MKDELERHSRVEPLITAQLRLDAGSKPGGEGYQTRMNAILRRAMPKARKSGG